MSLSAGDNDFQQVKLRKDPASPEWWDQRSLSALSVSLGQQ